MRSAIPPTRTRRTPRHSPILLLHRRPGRHGRSPAARSTCPGRTWRTKPDTRSNARPVPAAPTAQIATVGAGVITYSNTGSGRRTRPTTIGYERPTPGVIPPTRTKRMRPRSTAVPSAPSGLAATAVSTSQINLSWTDNVTNETGFKIERKTGGGGTYAEIATVGAGVTTYSDTGLTEATTYFYRVRATNAVGDSAYSNEANATTLPPSRLHRPVWPLRPPPAARSTCRGRTWRTKPDSRSNARRAWAAPTAQIATVGAGVVDL